MSIGNSLRRLAAVVEDIERDGVTVCGATMPADGDAIVDGKVHVTLDLALPLDEPAVDTESVPDDTAGETASEQAVVSGIVDEPSEPQVVAAEQDETPTTEAQETATGQTAPHDEPSIPVETEDGHAEDPTVVCPEPGCDETFESVPGMKIHRTKIHLRERETDEPDDVPVYRDPHALRDAYEAHDSFPAMREALGVDVSAQTVRRHMIRHGIHDPTAATDDEAAETGDPTDDQANASEPATEIAEDSTTGPESAETERGDTPGDHASDEPDEADDSATTDDDPHIPESAPLVETLPSDVTAPADVTLAELKDAVRTADTLYDIQQQFDLDRTQARDLLGYLDLLELVHGRVATKREREELKAEIDSRIQQNIQGNSTSA